MLKKYFYDPDEPTAYSTLPKLVKVVGKKREKEVSDWLLKQDAYTLHKPVRRKFQRNFYTVSNINDVWELDLADMQNIAQYNDGVKYLLTCIDCFSRYAYVKPLNSKSSKDISKAFDSVLDDAKPNKPLVVRSDKGKEFLGLAFQKFLKDKNIEHRICKDPTIKCSMIERFNRTIKTKLYKYFTFASSYRYVDVLTKFVKSYNHSRHSTTGMAPVNINATNILTVWKRVKNKQDRIPTRTVMYKQGQPVRIAKEKFKFAKGFEQNFSSEIFKISKVIKHSPQPVYELCDLNDSVIDGHFYNYELTPVKITSSTIYDIDKILGSRLRAGIRQYLVRWKGYGPDFDSWINAFSVKKKNI
jgi:transposase InsO family protein